MISKGIKINHKHGKKRIQVEEYISIDLDNLVCMSDKEMKITSYDWLVPEKRVIQYQWRPEIADKQDTYEITLILKREDNELATRKIREIYGDQESEDFTGKMIISIPHDHAKFKHDQKVEQAWASWYLISPDPQPKKLHAARSVGSAQGLQRATWWRSR